MAAGIRPNTALAEASGIYCNRGIVVNDTPDLRPEDLRRRRMRRHRGIAYGLVAPLFEQAKVAANHLANYGIGRYTGSVTSTKLKVTGIDLFSAGDYRAARAPRKSSSTMRPAAFTKARHQGQQAGRRRALRRHRRWPVVLPAAEGWQDIHEIRDTLLFGQSMVGDVGHQGQSSAAAMSDDAEVCGCNGVKKGTIVKAIKEKGLFTLDEVKKHTKAASSCGSCSAFASRSSLRRWAAPTRPRRPTRSRSAPAPNIRTRTSRGHRQAST